MPKRPASPRRNGAARVLFVIPLCLALTIGLVAPALSQLPPERRVSLDVPSFSPVGSLDSARLRHTSTLLQNGKVLLTGGTSAYNKGVIQASAELFDPATGTFTSIPPMTRGRYYHTATLLQDGKVLITGGTSPGGGTTNTAELFDPASETFTAISSMITARYGHTATLLQSGEVLIAGGFGNGATDKAELFDPSTETFRALPPMVTMERFRHTATLLQNGKVLLAGGSFGVGFTNKAELFDPVSGTFTALPSMNSVRDEHTATLLPNGTVLLAGGRGEQGATNNTAELFDPALGNFIPLPAMTTPRESHSATLLPSGKVLLAGGGMFGAYGAWNTAELFDPVSSTFASVSSTMTSGRMLHAATLLPSGKVLAAGGYPGKDPTDLSGGFLSTKTADLFDPALGSFTSVLPSTMSIERQGHTATLLPSGKVLITGGQTEDLNTKTADLFDPATGTFTAVGNMAERRAFHSATLLPSGKVLIVGGWGFAYSNTAELFDPATGTFTTVPGTMSVARDLHRATLLSDGRVLITGGRGVSGITATAELFDPETGTFTALPSMKQKRIDHTATLLPDGEVLIAGGIDGYAFLGAKPTETVEVFDPVSATFTRLPSRMTSPRVYHTATMLPTGKVLITGGDTGTRYANSAELFDPATETFTALPNTMNSERYGHMATLLQDGTVLLAGGGNLYQGKNDNAAEIFDPATGIFTGLPPMTIERIWSSATLLLNGKVLFAGGHFNLVAKSGATNTAELFDPGLGISDARRPVVDAISDPVVQPASLDLTGTGFRGDTEASGGSYNSSATNYPIAQLMRVDDGRTFVPVNDSSKKWSATKFSSKTFGSGTPLPAGHYRLTVSTNGIPSIQRVIFIALPEKN
jgi:hypothetical protein